MITLTESAIKKVKEILSEEPKPMKLRTYVQGGGCSGFSYGFSLEDDPTQEDDFSLHFDGIEVVVDAMSAQYLEGAEIDYRSNLEGSQFIIKNPNAQTTCGCGSSFSPF
jgi:iron-sulfur cluster insertion protein